MPIISKSKRNEMKCGNIITGNMIVKHHKCWKEILLQVQIKVGHQAKEKKNSPFKLYKCKKDILGAELSLKVIHPNLSILSGHWDAGKWAGNTHEINYKPLEKMISIFATIE